MGIAFLKSYFVNVLAKKEFQLPNNTALMVEAWVLKIFNIRYVWRSIFVSLEKVFHFEKLSGYSNSFIYILRKIKMENSLKIFLGIFFRCLHCSNGTKRRLDVAVIPIEFFAPKNSCKISASLIYFQLPFQFNFGRTFYNKTAFFEILLISFISQIETMFRLKFYFFRWNGVIFSAKI